MPKLIIETSTVTDKAKVKKYLNKHEIAYVKNDRMDGVTYFFVDYDEKNIKIDGATYVTRSLPTEIDVYDTANENVPMKQPECDVIENIKDSDSYGNFNKVKIAAYVVSLAALIGIYVVLF
jgi:hypothetical protein